ncbi:MAG: hypothetical protein KIT09_27665 [Bryobacteraceae bacterium]|nr:hypothetical protein [Bryobacteraceae bacterium]
MSYINTEHPDYIAKKALWKTYRDLYVGGEQLKINAHHYLTRRQKEPLDVYGERLGRVYYENYVGSIIDWYAATLFRREPMVMVEGTNDPAKRFINEFTEDCDLKGSSLSEFFRRQLIEMLVSGSSYILLDFPRVKTQAHSRAEEEASGASRAYLVGYQAEQVINWSHDEAGNYDWVVLRSRYTHKESVESGELVQENRWLYYDKTEFRVYRQLEGLSSSAGPVELIDSGRHALAKQRRTPVFEMTTPEGLWLMNKAALLQLEHFNKSNALSWALAMGLFASPVVYSDREWNQIVGESYYIQLGPQDRFGWTEPEGHVFQIAADNLARLQEEIYRVSYVLSQAGGRFSSQALQSGVSKQRDFSVTQEVLRAYGDIVKDTMKRILRSATSARDDGLAIDVSGLEEFDIGDFGAELADAERLLNLGIPSPTLRRQVFKKLAFKYLCDVRQEVKDRIAQEIDAGEQAVL